MLQRMLRVGIVVSVGVLALLIAGGVVAAPAIRSEVSRPIGLAQTPAVLASASSFTIALATVVPSGLTHPVGIANAGDGSGRLFVVEQAGKVRVIKNGVLLATPYLSITAQVSCCGERGLLSIAFDPDFQTTRKFYLNYTNLAGNTVVERYTVADTVSDVANVTNHTIVLTIDQPESNHNGGQLQFGPNDNYLYIGMGDGGGGGDQHGIIGNGQNPGVLLGKMLRLNVRDVPTYTIPASNPFTQTAGYRPEIWALGLRNPWRFSFDRSTGDLYIGDVGQDCYEEIDYQAATSPGGENYGWRQMEGLHLFNPNNFNDCSQPPSAPVGLTRPITEYPHPTGEAVSGGFVYRGQAYPWLAGWYFYADYQTGLIWTMAQTQPGVWSGAQKLPSGLSISTFGEDENGEIYLADYRGAGTGALYKITATAPSDFSTSSKQASIGQALTGQTLTYTLVVRNTGGPLSNTIRLTDVIPIDLAYVPGTFTTTLGTADTSAAPTLKWSGVMSTVSAVTLTYAVTMTTGSTKAILNTATINPGYAPPFTRTAWVIANPHYLFLPVILRN